MKVDFEPDVIVLSPAGSKLIDDVSGFELNDVAALLKNGISAAQNGERERARMLLSRATEIDQRSEDAWMWLASISEFPEELLAFLNNVLDINPENERAREWRTATWSLLAKTFVQRGIGAHEKGSDDVAKQCFDQALTFDKECEMAWFWKASLAPSGDERANYLERVVRINPENEDARNMLQSVNAARSQNVLKTAKAAALAGKRQEALEVLDSVLRESPENAEAWVLKSHLSLDFEEKLDALEKALAIDPENHAARSGYDYLTSIVAPPEPPEPLQSSEVFEEKETIREQFTEIVHDEAPVTIEATPTGELAFPEEVATDLFVGPDNGPEHDEAPVTIEATPTDELAFPEEVATDLFVGPDEGPEHDEAPVMIEATPTPELEFPAVESAEFFAGGNNVRESETLTFDGGRKAEELFGPIVLETDADRETVDSLNIMPSDLPEEIAPAAEEHVYVPDTSEDYIIDDTEDGIHKSLEDEDLLEFPDQTSPSESDEKPQTTGFACPFCSRENESHAFECRSCHAALTLSDIEMLLSNTRANHDLIRKSVTEMEAAWNSREFNEKELTTLSVGHFNLGNYEFGLKYLQEASRLDPNNVILAGQLNAIAIRLEEMRRQYENHQTMPKGKTILVVDDSPTVRKLIAGKLEKSGHRVICAVDGIDGLARIEEGLPDLILLDITMPRMDGYQVCKHIRSKPEAKDLPIVMISGKDGFFDKVRGRMAGTTGYITKPFGPETLMKALETYLVFDSDLVQ